MDHAVSPTLRVWQLAESLRNYRERKELAIEAAAAGLRSSLPRWSKSKLQRIETRLYVPKPHEVEQLAGFYEVPTEDAESLVRMAGEARQKGWWLSSPVPKEIHTLVGLEPAATEIRQFQLALVPGLLQTSEYARALMAAIEPATPPETLESRVAARMIRQQALKSDQRPKVHAVLSESVIRCPVGAKWVMRGQLEHLIDLTHEFDVTVQILPLSVGPHPGMEGASRS